MAFARPFAYNTGSTISGTVQVGNLAVGSPTAGFESTGLKWWNGPDEELGYVIAHETPSGQPGADGDTAYLGFWRSDTLSESSYQTLASWVTDWTQNFTTGNEAYSWLNSNGYWSSWEFYNGTLTINPGILAYSGLTAITFTPSFAISASTSLVPLPSGENKTFYHDSISLSDNFHITWSGSPYVVLAVTKNGSTYFQDAPGWYESGYTYTFGQTFTNTDELVITLATTLREYENVGLGSSAIQACSSYPAFGVNKYSVLPWGTWGGEMYIFNDSDLSSPYTSGYIANVEFDGSAIMWKQTDSNGKVISQGTCP